MSNVNLEENLEDLVKQIQTANDKAVFDEILMLQKFIGQPMTDHAPVHVSFSFGHNQSSTFYSENSNEGRARNL